MGSGRAPLLFVGTTVIAMMSSPSAEAAEPGGAEEGPSRPLVAVGAGAATSFVSFAAGIVVVARASDRAWQNAGLLGAQAGLTLSPIVAHAIMGELGRGAIFALLPLVGLATNVTLAATIPGFIAHAPPPVQWTTIGAVTVSVFGATIGILDAVRERADGDSRSSAVASRRRPSWVSGLSVSPIVDRTMTGGMVGGSL